MKKIMLDTSECDKFLDHSDAYERWLQLLAEGKIELLSAYTHQGVTKKQRTKAYRIENTLFKREFDSGVLAA